MHLAQGLEYGHHFINSILQIVYLFYLLYNLYISYKYYQILQEIVFILPYPLTSKWILNLLFISKSFTSLELRKLSTLSLVKHCEIYEDHSSETKQRLFI